MDAIVKQAVELLRAGEVIAVPTETVYGLAADAMNPKAVLRIFELKNRPLSLPLAVLIENDSMLSNFACDIPKEAFLLTKHFWPGPLTIVLKKTPQVPDIVTSGGKTIGLRSPNHPITQAILHEFGGGLAAPSANLFGEYSPTTAEEVRKVLSDKLALVVDGGLCSVGIESTIVDLSVPKIRLLRSGAIAFSDIESVLKSR